MISEKQLLHGCVLLSNCFQEQIMLVTKYSDIKIHETILEKYFNVFENVFEKSNTL